MSSLTNPDRIPCPWECGFHTAYWDELGEHADSCPNREREWPVEAQLLTVEAIVAAKVLVDAAMEQNQPCPPIPAD